MKTGFANWKDINLGQIQNMRPRSMDYPCGPSPWTPSCTQSMDYLCGPLPIFEDEFY